ncbi:shikimate dehydrogenase [Sulfuricurvum sp.]|uniref:shikimate dehydrogenase n=1 Tax=Sulfuricurvum sp. TaxID=2025608 RepID=UPI00260B323E|nr:shikimate dehydrogenase [Sulfuricurvum sp.]MDD2267286.1 shikimate dehydrogenase [Sulfuricurvum sp.]MDD2782587.1 shikimate dehydrogenase [Sulfuricurvum sp.]
MKLFSIFGDPVHHSRSPLMHNSVFKRLGVSACYSRTHLSDGTQLRNVFESKKLSGANVTVPHKEAAYAQCDEVRGIAKTIKAVNTLVYEKGKLIGYNTDADGFMSAIQSFGPIKNALILGGGGTARALSIALRQGEITPTVLNRSSGRLDFFIQEGIKAYCWDGFTADDYDLIINTTSAGLSDNELPIPRPLLIELLSRSKGAVDVIYGKETPFLREIKISGLPYKDGSDMLLAQGVLASYLFLGGEFSLKTIEVPMQHSFSL